MESDTETASLILQFLLIALLTLVNAFFAAAEIAIVSMNKNKIRHLAEEGDKKALLLDKLMREPTKFLSTIQVGITFAGFFSSAYAATSISGELALVLQKINLPYSQDLALILVTLILSYVILVFGELYPKRLAMRKAEAIALFAVKPVLFIMKAAVPFVKLLSLSTNLLIKITGIDSSDLEEKVSREEIRSLVEVGQEHGAINETEKEMIDSIFEFDNKLAKQIMTPRTEVYSINLEKPLNEYLDELLEERYSRIPVFKGDSDNIVGILNMKDYFMEARKSGFDNVDIESIIRPAYFIPERKNIDELFKELQNSKNHIAILIDEYGSFSGIVTMEDLIEEVMGKIQDEYDVEDVDIKKIDDNTYLIKGIISIAELNDRMCLNLDEETEDYDTLGGLLITLVGHIPVEGEECIVEYDDIVFKVEEVKGKRIEKVKISLRKPEKDKMVPIMDNE
ncbi:MAG TPA: hemolysin family protein [Desulfitobacteriaceae bacterium]|nr:hemolysin family protein [Desulfitobacteriaceae bacterium]